jgi:hypothetical protein
MKIKLLLLILTCASFHNSGFSQTKTTNKKNQLEFSTGFNFGALQNLEIAPLNRYDYKGLVYKVGYQRTSKKNNLFSVQVDYLTSELQSDVIPVLNLDYAKVALRLSYLKNIYTTNKSLVHLGLLSDSNASIYSKSDNHRTIYNQSFAIAFRYAYRLNEKHSLSSNLAIPLVLLRSTHASSGIYSPKEYQSISWNIGYNYALSHRFNATFRYGFNYDRLQITSAFREVQYQISLGLNFNF